MDHALRDDRRLTFGCGLGLGTALLLLYYSNERTILHFSFAEKLFWAITYGWFGHVLILLPDSPFVQLRLGQGGVADVVLIIAVGMCGLEVHTRRQSRRLESSIQRLDLHGLARLHSETVSARMAAARIAELLASEGQQSYSGALRGVIREIWERTTGRTLRLQENILDALRACSEHSVDDLLFVLNSDNVDLPQLFAVAGTADVLSLLTQVSSMDVVTKARIIDALQRQADFRFLRRQQEAVVTLLQATHGVELKTLKDLLDEGGDFHNLHKLVFSDLSSDLHQLALDHIRQEGLLLCRDTSVRCPCKVISDIDDTLSSSGGKFPAGVDKRIPKHQIYPGVLALFRELTLMPATPCARGTSKQDSGQADQSEGVARKSRLWSLTSVLFETRQREENSVWFRVAGAEWIKEKLNASDTVATLQSRLAALRQDASVGPVVEATNESFGDISFSPPRVRVMSNLVFLSARPHAFKDYAERATFTRFEHLRKTGMMHCMPTLLPGRVSSSGGAFLGGVVIEFRSKLGLILPVVFIAAFAMHGTVVHPNTATWLILLCTYIYGIVTTRHLKRAVDVWRPVGRDKVRNFLEYRQLYSECTAVFFGDNGQGDLLCGEELARRAASNDGDSLPCVSAVFIHEVMPREKQLTTLPADLGDQEKRLEWARLNIYFHKTYVGAAVNAFRCKLLSAEALSRVGTAAVEDLVRMSIDCSGATVAWEQNVEDLNADLEVANTLLPPNLKVPVVPSSTGQPAKMTHSRSMTSFEFTTQNPKQS